MTLVAITFLTIGIGSSIATFVHDLRRLRLGATMPQAAPKRLPPEIHALGALLTGGASYLLSGWLAALGALIAHAALAYAALPPLIEKLALRRPGGSR
jgi:hypothetical protein